MTIVEILTTTFTQPQFPITPSQATPWLSFLNKLKRDEMLKEKKERNTISENLIQSKWNVLTRRERGGPSLHIHSITCCLIYTKIFNATTFLITFLYSVDPFKYLFLCI